MSTIVTTILGSILTGLGMLVGSILVKYITQNYWGKMKKISTMQRKVHQEMMQIQNIAKSQRIAIYKFGNGEHFLSSEPILKVIKEYEYPYERTPITGTTYLFSQFSPLVNLLHENEKLILRKDLVDMELWHLFPGIKKSLTIYKLANGKRFYGFLVCYHEKQITPKAEEKIQEHLEEIVALIGELSTVSILRKMEKVLYGTEI